jgi:hypothetical protein
MPRDEHRLKRSPEFSGEKSNTFIQLDRFLHCGRNDDFTPKKIRLMPSSINLIKPKLKLL